MLLEALGAVRDMGRVQEIAAVLIRYGFGDVVQRVGLAGVLERAGRMLHWQAVREDMLSLSPPQRVRRALEDLGPTFVKLGQILATRVDLFGPEWIAEFGRLQDAVPAVPFEEIAAQLEEDLGCPPHEAFRNLKETPLAAASLGQAYLAELADGRDGGAQGAPPGHPPAGRGRPQPARPPGRADRGRGPRSAPLPPARGGARVHPLAAARARLRRRVPQRRAHRAQLRRSTGDRRARHSLAVVRRAAERPGLRRRHRRARPRGGRCRRPRPPGCSPVAAPPRC